MSNVKTILLKFITEEAGLTHDEITPETALFSEGYIDSFTMTSVIAFIEDTQELEIPQSEITLENFDTINNMATFIARAKA
jgi:acyl carrier protein